MCAKKQEEIYQPEDMVFVLDIGTRSIIGLAGTVEDDKLKVIAIESAEHPKRAMIDGQIEDISAVARLAMSVKEQIEAKLDVTLTRVCVAAAGRALKTERATYEMDVPNGQAIDADLINQLESGAIEKIEDSLRESAADSYKQFYLVGYSTVQYYLDEYPISHLLDHHGSKMKADILATFLPSEVVESLYAVMHQAGLEVASLTLEPIAAINAAIPENLRLLNLSFADIGAGTSDIAVCKDGNVVGYTMATIAGDEITETLMKEYLIDFETAEQIKADLDSKKEIYFTDIMGLEQTVPTETILESLSECISTLCAEIAEKILEINGGPPSAVFLGGGGSKMHGVLEGVTSALKMDEKRVAIAGNNFKATAFSKEYDLNNPEYATPLGIAVSTGLNMINDSYHLTLNGKRARLFRNGQLNVLNVLTMNGYRYRDLFGRSGASLIVKVNGKRTVLYGKPATNSILILNGETANVNDLVKAGDVLEFTPAQSGEPAQATVADILDDKNANIEVTINGQVVSLDAPLSNGDVITTRNLDSESDAGELSTETPTTAEAAPTQSETIDTNQIAEEPPAAKDTPTTPVSAPAAPAAEITPAAEEQKPSAASKEAQAAPAPASETMPKPAAPVNQPATEPQKYIRKTTGEVISGPDTVSSPGNAENPSEPEIPRPKKTWHFTLNGNPVSFPAKPDNAPYLLLDMLQHSGLDFDNLTAPVILAVNGMPGIFQQQLRQNDSIIIKQDDEQ